MVLADDFFQLFGREAGVDIDGDSVCGAEGVDTFFGDGIGDENAVVAHEVGVGR